MELTIVRFVNKKDNFLNENEQISFAHFRIFRSTKISIETLAYILNLGLVATRTGYRCPSAADRTGYGCQSAAAITGYG